MKAPKNRPVIEQLVGPLAECLTLESARRLLALKPDPELQACVDEIASRHTEGQLTPKEEAEYVSYATFIAILKSNARQLIASSSSK